MQNSTKNTFIFVGLFYSFKLILFSFLGLSDDEAYYWNWSQHLSLSYYDHPPLTAWFVALSGKIFGTSVFAARWPAMFFSLSSLVLLFNLSKKIFDETVASRTLLLFALVPTFSFSSHMLFPDILLMFFWLAFMNISWNWLSGPDQFNNRHWLLLGCLLGLAFISKYPAVFLACSFFILMLSQAHGRRLLLKLKPWLALVMAIVVCMPVILWNFQHEWPSFQFHLTQRHSGGSLSWTRFGQFLATQVGLLTPFIFIGIFIVFMQSIKKINSKSWLFILCFACPPLLVFYIQPMFSDFKPHWPAPAYIPLLIGLGYWFKDIIGKKKVFWNMSVGFLIFFNAFFFTALCYPVLPKLHMMFLKTPWQARFDITNDFYGWPEAGRKAQEYIRKSSDGGKKVFLATHRYQLTAPLTFYSGQQVWNLGEHNHQYRFWQNTKKLTQIKNADSIVVTDNRYFRKPLETMKFDYCEQLPSVKVYRRSVLAREFFFWHCEGFDIEQEVF